MDVYIESICGDCHRFVANELKFIGLHPELLDYVDLDIHIFGKARIVDETEPRFLCQFGEPGCVGNRALGCIYHHSTSFYNAIRVMECMFENRLYSETSIQMCYAKFGLNSNDAVTCFKGSEANELLLEAGKQTPVLRWVPGFRTDGDVRLDTRNVVNVICASIQGEKPSVCNQTKHTVGMNVELYVLLLQQSVE